MNLPIKTDFKLLLTANLKITSLDPSSISYVNQYYLLKNLYSPLIEFNEDNIPVSGIAQSFSWEKNNLILTIRHNLKSSQGEPITLEDIRLSLFRHMILNRGTHGDLKSLLGITHKIVSLTDSIPQVSVKKESNQIILSFPQKNSEILTTLSSMDFAIIPKSSFDQKTFKIINFSNTSGPYSYLTENNNEYLVANLSHYNYSPKMPQKILIIRNNYQLHNENQLFQEKLIDIIPAAYNLFLSDLTEIAKKNKSSKLYRSAEIKNFYAQFHPHTLTSVSINERFFIGKKLKEIFKKYYGDSSIYKDSKQFILANSNGGLSKLEEDEISHKIDSSTSPQKFSKLTLSLWVHAPLYQKIEKAIRSNLPQVTILKYSEENDKKSDITVIAADVGFSNDSTFLHYNLNYETFGITKAEGKKRFEEYCKLKTTQEKIIFFHKLHKNALNSGMLIPLISFPSMMLLRNSWELINQNPLSVSQPLWNLRKR